MKRHLLLLSIVLGIVLLLAAVVLLATPAPTFAQDSGDSMPETGEAEGGDGYCLLCHSQPDQTYTLPDGSVLDITINPDHFADSVHSELGCTQCHGDMSYPHETPVPTTSRDYTMRMAVICTTCHEEQASGLVDDLHYQALADGQYEAATCVDCHGAHEVQSPQDNREIGALACSNCHVIAFDQYENSVHGAALFAGDPNVPSCIDCHGVHGIEHPTTAQFRNNSPELCGECHADKDLMNEYGITTNVFDSYLSDFHGTTVALFEERDPNVATNKAVCYDCHGVHDIARADAENSHVIKQNLLGTCQQCHPDATSDFADSWVGHYEPTFESHPLLYSVNLFYKLLIPGVLAGFAVLIGVDIFGRMRRRG
ncbi:MAG: cytochrome c3 family protein [Anaerolineae bacterium]|nr:cytochrome c3 family protein [Anaerolineae bacterium]